MNLIVRLLLAVAVFGLAACEVPTGGSSRVVVEITGAAPAWSIRDQPDGWSLANCDIALTARATGNGEARWQDAKLSFYYGMNRTGLADTTSVPAWSVRDAWGGATLRAGETRTGGWAFWAPVPFTVTVDSRYVDADGREGSAPYSFTCGPTPPSGGVAAPSISNVMVSINNVVAGSGSVPPGGRLNVGWLGRSSAGLWVTGFEISGAFSARVQYSEHLQPASSRGGTVQVPLSAPRGEPIVIRVFAFDPFLQTALVSPAGTYWVSEGT